MPRVLRDKTIELVKPLAEGIRGRAGSTEQVYCPLVRVLSRVVPSSVPESDADNTYAAIGKSIPDMESLVFPSLGCTYLDVVDTSSSTKVYQSDMMRDMMGDGFAAQSEDTTTIWEAMNEAVDEDHARMEEKEGKVTEVKVEEATEVKVEEATEVKVEEEEET